MSGGQLNMAVNLPQLQEEKEVLNEGVVNWLVATGKIGTAEETGSINILDQEGVKVAGFGRGTEMIMSQIISFQEEVRERLGAIEGHLKKMEKGKGREGDADEEHTQRSDVEDDV